MDGSVLEEKSSFKMLGLTFSSKLDWGSYIIITTAKSASKKIGALIHSMKFLSPEIAHLYRSIIQPYMEYCCHVWAGAPSCYLELWEKLQKWICPWKWICYKNGLVLHLLPPLNPWLIIEM